MLISLTDIKVMFGEKTVLKDITASVTEDSRIGVVGVNGAGKTTLLNVIAGEQETEEGNLYVSSTAEIGYLKQNSGLESGNSIMDEMRSVFAEVLSAEKKMRELEHAISADPDDASLGREYSRLQAFYESRNGYNIDVEIKKVLSGMGFASRDLSGKINLLSGGEKTRLAIAKLLLASPDLLILDEPTNHLDFATLRWLEDYLASYKGAVIIVSHDRYFLDRTASAMWEIEGGTLTEYAGNYSQYKILKSQRMSALEKEYEKQQRSIEKMEDYIRKNMARASTSSSAKSRVKQLEHMEIIEKPRKTVSIPSFSFKAERRGGNDVLSVTDVPVCVGSGQKLISEAVSFELKRGSRTAVIGENGSGKTTFIKTLIGMIPNAAGEIKFGRDITVGYYDQEAAIFDPKKTVFGEMSDRYPLKREFEIRSLLGRVLIKGEDVFTEIGSLSGGEKAKIGFAILMEEGANLLVLDEPTNHLDLQSREKLEQALKEYDGTVIFVSHDRYFIRALADHVIEISCGRTRFFPFGFDEYEEKVSSEEKDVLPEAEKPGPKVNPQKQRRRETAKKREALSRCTKRMDELDSEIKDLREKIKENPSDYSGLSEWCSDLEKKESEYETVMTEWMELSDEE